MSTVVIVENERQLARLAELNLTAEGFQVIIFYEGREAWSYLPDHRPDLIILDLMMPVFSGWELLDCVRQEQKLLGAPVLVLSALAHPDEKRRAMAAGATAYLVKPCSPRQLIESVKHLVTRAHEDKV